MLGIGPIGEQGPVYPAQGVEVVVKDVAAVRFAPPALTKVYVVGQPGIPSSS
jgi:hypothetical protein